MKLEDLLKEEVTAMRLGIPNTIDGLIKFYQEMYKLRFSKKMLKQHAAVRLMTIGMSKFRNEAKAMKQQHDKYNAK